MRIELNDPIVILSKWNCQFDRGDFAVGAAFALLELYIEVSLAHSRKIAILKIWSLSLSVPSYCAKLS